MPSPAGLHSSEPNFTKDSSGTIYLSWVQLEKDTSYGLYFSELTSNKWSKPIQIIKGNNWFINWADFPTMSAYGQHSLAAHILVAQETGKYAYDIHLITSGDKGKSWSKNSIIPHLDSTPTEHGFLSLLPYKDQLLAMWLDGRNYFLKAAGDSVPTQKMSLRSVFLGPNQQLTAPMLIDSNVCSCCQTDAAIVSTGPILVYRDRSDQEIRDIAQTRLINGEWTRPQAVFEDGWEIGGCPVNGPAIDAKDSLVIVAWYTEAHQQAAVKVAFSDNAGASFQKAIPINAFEPIGRVDVVLLADGSAMISWLEQSSKDASLKLTRVFQDGRIDAPISVLKTKSARSSGFPKMIEQQGLLYFAWTQLGENPQVRTSYMKIQ